MDVERKFSKAVSLHLAGRIDQASEEYKKIIKKDGKNERALTNLGVIRLQQGRYRESIELLKKSLQIKPNQAFALNNLASALHEMKEHESALAYIDRALCVDESYHDAHYNKGVILQDLDRHAEAIECFDRALASSTGFADAYAGKGSSLRELGRVEEALASFESSIELDRSSAVTYNNHGLVLQILGMHEQAIISFDKALVLDPKMAEAHNNKGVSLRALRRFADALTSFDAAIRVNPDFAEAHNNRGATFMDLSRPREAYQSFNRAVEIMPNLPDPYFGRGSALMKMRYLDRALEDLDRVVQLKPDFAEAHAVRAMVLEAMYRGGAALESYRIAFGLKAEQPFLLGRLVHCMMKECYWDDYEEWMEKVKTGVAEGRPVCLPFDFLAMCSDPALQRACAEVWFTNKFGPVKQNDKFIRADDGGRQRIRIGYFSSDFREHPVSYLLVEVLELHDRTRFEVLGFAIGDSIGSEMRNRVSQAVDKFIEFGDLSDAEAVSEARGYDLDIAVDLNGYTDGSRTGVFAARVAPVQVNFLGYAGTMGIDAIDYLIGDAIVNPDKDREAYSEHIVYMPDTYLPIDRKRKIAELSGGRGQLGLPGEGFVFCSFCNTYKITPGVFDIWMRLLNRVPRSVLWLSPRTDSCRRQLRHEAERWGVSADRLIFAEYVPSQEDHLARYRAADLFLDTFEFNAITTASDALWAGLPVLTLLGESMASRSAASLLRAAGLPELIARSETEYERIAYELATDGPRLRQVRKKLAANRDSCPLFDTIRYARNLEHAYESMWGRNAQGLRPADIRFDVGAEGAGLMSC